MYTVICRKGNICFIKSNLTFAEAQAYQRKMILQGYGTVTKLIK